MAREVVVGSTHLVRDASHDVPMFKIVRGTREPYSYSEIVTGDVIDLTEDEVKALISDYEAITAAEAAAAEKKSAPAAPPAPPAAPQGAPQEPPPHSVV